MDAPKIFKNINGSTIAMYCTNKVQKYLKNIDECSNKAQYQLISWVPEDLRSSSRPQSLESVVHYLRQPARLIIILDKPDARLIIRLYIISTTSHFF